MYFKVSVVYKVTVVKEIDLINNDLYDLFTCYNAYKIT